MRIHPTCGTPTSLAAGVSVLRRLLVEVGNVPVVVNVRVPLDVLGRRVIAGRNVSTMVRVSDSTRTRDHT